jgi:hypothetical protein
MDAPELRQRIGQLTETLALSLGELVALAAEYDAELLPPPPPEILLVPGDSLQAAIAAAHDGAVINLQSFTFSGPVALSRPVTLKNGTIVAPPNCNDLVNITGPNVVLMDLVIRGDGTTKRGIAANGTDMVFIRIRVENICRNGQETQAVAIWNGTGLSIFDSYLEAGSTCFLSGGASPAIPNHVPADILIENCILSRPEAWRGMGYAVKTSLELKSSRRVRVINTVMENVWLEAQTAWAITLTPSQYGNSPETIVEDVLFDGCTVRNCGGGVNALGFSQHQSTRPTLKSQRFRFVNCNFSISRAWARSATSIPHGSLMQLGGGGPVAMIWAGCTATLDGDAFLRTSGDDPIAGFGMSYCSMPTGSYGIWTPNGSRGGAWVATAFPGIGIEDNDFVGAPSLFRQQFPDNTYL